MRKTDTSRSGIESSEKTSSFSLSDLALIILAVAAAIGAMVGFAWLANYSDQHRKAQVSLGRIDTLAYELNTVEATALANGSYTEVLAMREKTCLSQIEEQTTVLNTLSVDPATLQQISDNYAASKTAALSVHHQLSYGHNAAASHAMKAQLDPALGQFYDTLYKTGTQMDFAAEQANRLSIAGSVGMLVFTLLLLATLFKRTEGRRQQAANLAIERRSLRQSEAKLFSLVANATDIIMILERNGTIRYVTPAASKVIGMQPGPLLGSKVYNIIHHDDVAHARNTVDQSAASPGVNIQSEFRLLHEDGSWRHAEVILINQLGQPEVTGIIATLRDITERKQFEEQLTHHAFHDALTGLPNRALLLDRLNLAISRTTRSGRPVAVVFIDLDNFKLVNDTLGHQAGDKLLLEVSARLESCLRPEDTLARLGGDEFVILIENAENDVAVHIAQRIVAELERPVNIEGRDCFTPASIGIALSNSTDDEAQFVLRDADTAMYEAKMTGKGRYSIFDRSMNVKAEERLHVETELRSAIERNEIVIQYQPIVTLGDSHVIGVEALARWEHPTRGTIMPAKFISIAEETGAIIGIGKYVLNEACRQLQMWQRDYPAERDLTMSVNVSPRQFHHPDLVEDVRAVLRRYSITPRNLKLEITESITMADGDGAIARLEELKALGVQLAVDDFGTGYSSMAYLKAFPIDTIKIDRSFIGRLGEETEDEAIIKAIITLAKTMKLNVTSEGIETAEQLSRLQALGCDQGQGFFFTQPVDASEICVMLDANAPAPVLKLAA